MKLTIMSPTVAVVANYTDEEMSSLKKQLSYVDLAAKYELKRLSKNFWFKKSNPLKWKLQCDLLKSQINKSLVFEDGLKFIRPGSIPYLEGLNLEIEDLVVYPKPKKIPWAKKIPFELYPYQKESVEKLMEIKHGNVELCTGAGKSMILLNICRETGFRCAVVAPSKSIFNELITLFEKYLGKGMVGKFGNGKKKLPANAQYDTSANLNVRPARNGLNSSS